MSDPRPENCRFRLQDAGKPYPRSSCRVCGRTITTGLGNRCHLERDPPERTYTQAELDAAVRAEREACARVAADNAKQMANYALYGESSHSRLLESMEAAATKIAASIRERKE